MHEYAPEIAHQPQPAQLEAGLHAGADHPGGIDSARREIPGGDRSRDAGAQVREVAVVEQHRFDEAGDRAHDEHESAAIGQAVRGVVEEARCDLDRESVQSLDIRGLDVDFAVVGRDVHPHDGRHADAAFRQAGETERHGLGCLIRHRDATADLAFVQHQYAHGACSRVTPRRDGRGFPPCPMRPSTRG